MRWMRTLAGSAAPRVRLPFVPAGPLGEARRGPVRTSRALAVWASDAASRKVTPPRPPVMR